MVDHVLLHHKDTEVVFVVSNIFCIKQETSERGVLVVPINGDSIGAVEVRESFADVMALMKVGDGFKGGMAHVRDFKTDAMALLNPSNVFYLYEEGDGCVVCPVAGGFEENGMKIKSVSYLLQYLFKD